MALKKSVLFKSINIADAYLRIFQFEGNKDHLHVGLEFCKDSGSERFDSLTIQNIPFDINGKNPIAQAYDYIKSQPEFADSQDC